MRWQFGPDDEDAFAGARRELLRRFGRFARSHDLPTDDAPLLLDYKWGYGDGNLVRWTRADVESFLLDWVPRKVVMPADLVDDLALGP